jgi:hypothetical protein
MAIVTGGGVLVLLLGGLASGIGVGTATLLMGIVVAALVVCDELRRGLDAAATTWPIGRRPKSAVPGHVESTDASEFPAAESSRPVGAPGAPGRLRQARGPLG